MSFGYRVTVEFDSAEAIKSSLEEINLSYDGLQPDESTHEKTFVFDGNTFTHFVYFTSETDRDRFAENMSSWWSGKGDKGSSTPSAVKIADDNSESETEI